jgi:hypothetical protein
MPVTAWFKFTVHFSKIFTFISGTFCDVTSEHLTEKQSMSVKSQTILGTPGDQNC